MRLLVIAGIAVCLVSASRAAAEPAVAHGLPSLVELAGPPIPDDENAALVYQQVFALLKAAEEDGKGFDVGRFLSGERRDAAAWASAREAVDRAAPALALVDDAVARPHCRFPVDWDAGFAALFPHLGQLRGLARYLCAQALLDARDGKSAEAVRSLTRVFQVGESVKNEPILILTLSISGRAPGPPTACGWSTTA